MKNTLPALLSLTRSAAVLIADETDGLDRPAILGVGELGSDACKEIRTRSAGSAEANSAFRCLRCEAYPCRRAYVARPIRPNRANTTLEGSGTLSKSHWRMS